MKSRTLFFFCRSLLLLGLFFVSAQIVSAASPVSTSTQPAIIQQPEVYVIDLKLDKNTYTAGETVKGSFSLQDHQGAVPDLYYSISLVGKYRGSLSSVTYDTKFVGPFFIGNEEEKSFDFSYTLPSSVVGNGLGIQIGAFYGQGTPLGWNDAHITITGEARVFVDVSKAKLIVEDITPFDLLVGPMVKKNIHFKADLFSPSSTSLPITPRLTVYRRSLTGPKLLSKDEPIYTLESKKAQTFDLELPIFDMAPGVYIGTLQFLDGEAAPIAPMQTFRYIISGDIVTLYSLTSDKQTLKTGDDFTLTLSYSAAPYDISTGDIVKIEGTTLSLTVFNEKDEIIAAYSTPIDFNSGTQKDFSLKATGSSQALRTEVKVMKGDKVLATYSGVLVGEYGKEKQKAEDTRLYEILFAIAFVALIACLFAVRIFKKNSTKTSAATPLIVFLVIFFSSFIFSNHAFAWSITATSTEYQCDDCKHSDEFIPTVTISEPSLYTRYKPGETFSLVGTVTAHSCANALSEIQFTVEYNGETFTPDRINNVDSDTGTIDTGKGKGHKLVVTGGKFEITGLTTPTYDELEDPYGNNWQEIKITVDNYIYSTETAKTKDNWRQHGSVTGTEGFYVHRSVIGSLDGATCTGAWGWVCDQSTKDSVDVSIDVSGGYDTVGSDYASDDRSDLVSAGCLDTGHAFNITWDTPIEGDQNVQAIADNGYTKLPKGDSGAKGGADYISVSCKPQKCIWGTGEDKAVFDYQNDFSYEEQQSIEITSKKDTVEGVSYPLCGCKNIAGEPADVDPDTGMCAPLCPGTSGDSTVFMQSFADGSGAFDDSLCPQLCEGSDVLPDENGDCPEKCTPLTKLITIEDEDGNRLSSKWEYPTGPDIYKFDLSECPVCPDGTESPDDPNECDITTQVTPTPEPTVVPQTVELSDFKAVPAIVAKGSPCNLSWQLNTATLTPVPNCTITPGDIDVTGETSYVTDPLDSRTIFTLNCSADNEDADGNLIDTVTDSQTTTCSVVGGNVEK